MRLLVLLVCLMLAGCAAPSSDEPDPEPTTSAAPPTAPTAFYLHGDSDLYMDDDQGATNTQVTIRLTPAEPSQTLVFPLRPPLDEDVPLSGVGVLLLSTDDTNLGGSIDVEARLTVDGVDAGSGSGGGDLQIPMPETLPAGADIELQITFSMEGVGVLSEVVLHTDGRSALQLPLAGGGGLQGSVEVFQRGAEWVARRVDTFNGDLGGLESWDLDLSTTNGNALVDAGGQGFVLEATLEGRGQTEQQARDNLAQIYVDYSWAGGALDAHARTTEDGPNQWQDKAATFELTAEMLPISSADISTTNGNVRLAGFDVGSADLSTTNGNAAAEGAFTNLDTSSSNGNIVWALGAPLEGGSWDASTTNGNIDVTLSEQDEVGYDIFGSVTNGAVTFNFDDTEPVGEQSSRNRHERTNGFEEREVQIDVDLSTTNGNVDAGS